MSNDPVPLKRRPYSSEEILQQLKDSERIFCLLVDSVCDYGIFMLDPRGNVVTWNEGAQRIKGYSPNEIIGQHFSLFYTPEALIARHPDFGLESALTAGRYEEEGWRVRKDGTRFWANVVITPVYEQEQLIGFAKVTRDLTERRMSDAQREESARQSEIFRLLVGSVKDYAIFMLDDTGHVRTWNEGAQRINGYSADEIIGKHFSTFYTDEDNNRNHPEEELVIAKREGRYEEEGWRVRKDGTRFWANVVITSVYENGRLVGFAKVTRDLTERRKAEQQRDAAARQEEHFQLMINVVRDYAIFMLDANGHVRTWNEGAKRIKGYEANEIIGQHFSIFYPQEMKDIRHPDRELEIASEKGWYEEEGWRIRKDGSTFWANVVITALRENGALIGFVKVTRDLTERRNAEKAREEAFNEVRKANDELQHLAYTVSHELQEPLTAITSYSKLLSSRYAGRLGEDADEFLLRIKRGAKMTARLIDDLWTYARVTRPGVPHTQTATSKLIREAKEELTKLITARQAEITHTEYEHWPVIEANGEQLVYVFKELIVNAIKHNTTGNLPRIEITVERERNGWSFNFADNGPGIDRFFAQQVFSLYQRLNSKPDETGTGMGLPICRKIIEEQHHGRIGFESFAGGGGAKFFVWIPD